MIIPIIVLFIYHDIEYCVVYSLLFRLMCCCLFIIIPIIVLLFIHGIISDYRATVLLNLSARPKKKKNLHLFSSSEKKVFFSTKTFVAQKIEKATNTSVYEA